ncbi:C40 family peptidase [Geobacter sp. SVR]|uniref:C40 family peptidase n=1 Tax=Geobacter sp. SVR TaxID=2495594 RepID=UPI00143EFDFC|nr:C40 family peptidase [Geobacter sp. SVR]BCS53885.1 hypothetical protein GSVR_21930 [Geobacter sp. SVR]GCF85606.1 hypothetical protein GSbR_22060 [Geobacter sp. SVR]
MTGIIRTACLCILCLVGLCIVTPAVEAKEKKGGAAVRSTSKNTARQSPRKERGRTTKGKEGKTSLAQSHRQRSGKPRRTPERDTKKRSAKKPAEKLISLQARQGELKPARVSITERLAPQEVPEEILTAELGDEVRPLEEAAFRLVGTRYRFGGNSVRGMDCSAFVQRVYSGLKIPIPRTAREQFGIGTEIPPDEVKKGDLVFFHTYARYPSHVAIYLGDNRMIHASSGSGRVVISNMDTPYYRSRYVGARRLPAAEGEPLPQLLAGL